jgi:hypothetical protein
MPPRVLCSGVSEAIHIVFPMDDNQLPSEITQPKGNGNH